jgi:hypothetical protein
VTLPLIRFWKMAITQTKMELGEAISGESLDGPRKPQYAGRTAHNVPRQSAGGGLCLACCPRERMWIHFFGAEVETPIWNVTREMPPKTSFTDCLA